MSPVVRSNPCASALPAYDAALVLVRAVLPQGAPDDRPADPGTPLRAETLEVRFETVTPVSTPAPRPAEAPHWTQHAAREFPHRSGDHAPNLATLAQLRSGGRNPLLLSAKRRRQVAPKGCTQR